MTPKQKAIDKAIDAACDSGQILHRWQIEAFLASLAASGYAIVPVEVTGSMIFELVDQRESFARRTIAENYRAMLAAAQKEQG